MFFVSNRTIEFAHWLQVERTRQELSQSDLARKSGLNRAVINNIESGRAFPAPKTLSALAEALDIAPVVMFRIAGVLAEGTEDQIQIEDWKFILSQLPPEEQEELRQIAQLKIKRRKRAEEQARAKQRKPIRAGP